MKNLTDFYILGLPIEMDIGNINFIKVKDYPDYAFELDIMSLDNIGLAYKYIALLGTTDDNNKAFDGLCKLSLIELISLSKDVGDIYKKVFSHVFNDENILKKITTDNFDELRNLVLKMNCVKQEKCNPNPEIQMWIEKSKRVKARQSGGLTFSDIVSAVSVYKKMSYFEIGEMTLYQLYSDFTQVSNYLAYDTSTLFATVSSEKIKIPDWCSHIDLYAEEKIGLSKEEFEKMSKKTFG